MTVEQTPPENVADYLPRMAAQQPDATAIYFPTRRRDSSGQVVYTELSYRDLDQRATRVALGLRSYGVDKGDRAALMVKPSPDLFALTFGMFKAGVVPVMIDPGIGRESLGSCIANAEPTAFVGISLAHAARCVFGWGRKTIRRKVTVGRRWFWGGATLAALEDRGAELAAAGETLPRASANDIAAVLFTSGSTGPPKGVIYRQRHFLAQVEAIREQYGIEPGEIDLPTFPLFALFDPALGMTTVIPDMDATRPGSVAPPDILDPIERFDVTMMFGSPALLATVGRAGERSRRRLPSLRRIIAAGAPLAGETMEQWHSMMPEGTSLFPSFGATESLPIATLSSQSILEETWPRTVQGEGVCVGNLVATASAEIIRISDDPIGEWKQELLVEDGEVGEIVVSGPMVTEEYYGDRANTELSKIKQDARIWHRMGDLGWRDEQGRLWYCGRKSQRVVAGSITLYTEPCEKIFEAHAGVRRAALVGPRRGGVVEPTLCIELESGAAWKEIQPELVEIAAGGPQGHADTQEIRHVLCHPEFPVDRHSE